MGSVVFLAFENSTALWNCHYLLAVNWILVSIPQTGLIL